MMIDYSPMPYRTPHIGLTLFIAIPLLLADTQGVGSTQCNTCPSMSVIQPGTFEMGATADDPASSPDERPRHSVSIAYTYALAQHQVTRGAFAEFMRASGYIIPAGCWSFTQEGWRQDPEANWASPGFAQTDSHPVVCISRDDALAYLAWLSDTTARHYRLPTEAEWEWAARGEGPQPFWGIAENICTFANVNDITSKNKVAKVGENCIDGALYTAPVAHYTANPNGLYDMIGNAWEWTADCASDDYQKTPTDGSAYMQPHCSTFTLRGHSWTDAPGPVRIETRYALPPDARQSMVGFRVAEDQSTSPAR